MVLRQLGQPCRPEAVRNEAALYAGCISGAVQREDYLRIIGDAGLINVKVQKERKSEIRNEIPIR
jgi:arsenite methyltransferase